MFITPEASIVEWAHKNTQTYKLINTAEEGKRKATNIYWLPTMDQAMWFTCNILLVKYCLSQQTYETDIYYTF